MNAIDSTLRSLIDSGYIVDVPKDALGKKYSYSGKCYQVINLNNLSVEN